MVFRAAFAAVSMFNYFLSWKKTEATAAEDAAARVDAVDVWHLLSLSFLLAMCAEVRYRILKYLGLSQIIKTLLYNQLVYN